MNVYMTARFYTRTDKHSSTHIVSARVVVYGTSDGYRYESGKARVDGW